MKKVLFTILLFAGVASIASVNAHYIYDALQVQEQEVTRVKCKKVFGGVTCVRVTDDIQSSVHYHCTLKLTKNDTIRI